MSCFSEETNRNTILKKKASARNLQASPAPTENQARVMSHSPTMQFPALIMIVAEGKKVQMARKLISFHLTSRKNAKGASSINVSLRGTSNSTKKTVQMQS